MWTATVELLTREVEHLGGREAVLQLAVGETDLRLDGWVRASARPSHPGVIVAFDSRHGPLRYHTDQFSSSHDYPGWQANVRAVALGLEALRKIDRYGITGDGEQYTGFRALPAGDEGPMTVEEAALFIAQVEGGPNPTERAPYLVADAYERSYAYRSAAKTLHPDHGGDPALFRRLQQARDLLEAR
jgi:hypothetical protein